MRPLITLLGVLTFAAPAAAQTLQDACNSLSKISVGQWAAYRATMSQMGSEPMQMRMAIVGQETKNGTPHYWYELKISSQRGNMIMQALVPGWPYDQGQIAGMIMKAGDRPAMRLPDQMIGMMSRRPGGSSPARDLLKECTSSDVVGTESVTVPAGTFDALHIHATTGEQADVWVSPDVPFGMVRMKSADAEMELTGKGTDAKSSITETPQGM